MSPRPAGRALRRPRLKRPIPAVAIPLKAIHLSSGAITDVASRRAVDSKLNAALKELLKDAIDTTDGRVEALIDALPLDHGVVANESIGAIVRTTVVPELLKDAAHQKLAAVLTERRFEDEEPARARLQTHLPLSEHPLFEHDVRKAKSRDLLRITNLNPLVLDKIDERGKPLERWSDDDWDDVVSDGTLTEAERDTLPFAGELSRLTGEDYQLVEAARAAGVNSPADLVKWDAEQWRALLASTDGAGTTDAVLRAHAEELAAAVRHAFPSEYLASRLANPAEAARLSPDTRARLYRHLGDGDAEITARLGSLTRFLETNAEDLRLAPLLDDAALDWDGIAVEQRTAVRNQALAYQRVLNLADDPDTAVALLRSGLDSSAAIADLDFAEFRRQTQLPESTAAAVYNVAQRRATRAAHAVQLQKDAMSMLEHRRPFRGLNPAFINDLKDLAGWEDLFGSTAFCDCQHCRSIFSPAAYFTDLMYFIDKQITRKAFVGKPSHPLRLDLRRPDLWRLRLTCDNTNGLIPHLTLVNEILDSYVAQTLSIEDVDQALSTDRSAIGLPYHAGLSSVRELLRDWKAELPHIYALLDAPATAIDKETLRLSDPEWNALAGSSVDTAWIRFPTAEHSRMDAVEFLAFTALTRDELESLRSAETAGGFTIARVAVGDDIQSEKEVVEGLSDALLSRIGKFLRLRRATGFTILELDEVLRSARIIGSTPFSTAGLTSLARFTRLQRDLGLSVESLVAILDHIPTRALTRGATALTARINLPAFASNGAFPVTLHHARFNASNPNDAAVDVRLAALLNVLGVTESDLLGLFAHYAELMPFDVNGNVSLSADDLALLYSHVTLARAWSIAPADLSMVVARLLEPEDRDFRSLNAIEALQTNVRMLVALPQSFTETFLILDPATTQVTVDQVTAIVSALQQSGARLFTGNAISSLPGMTPDDGAAVIADLMAAGLVKAVGDRYALTGAYVPGIDLEPALSAKFVLRKDEIHRALLTFHFVNLLPNALAATARLPVDKTLAALAFVQPGWNGPGMLQALETAIEHFVAVQPDDLAPLLTLANDLARLGRIVARLQLDVADLWFVAQYPSLFDIADRTQLTVANLDAIRRYRALTAPASTMSPEEARNLVWQYQVRAMGNAAIAAGSPFAAVANVPVFAEALTSPLRPPLTPAPAPAFSSEQLVQSPLNAEEIALLADRHQLEASLLRSIFLSVPLPSDALAGLARARQLYDFCVALRIGGASLNQFVKRDAAGLRALNDLLTTLLEDKYRDEASREKNIGPHLDVINMQRRDALCDFVIARPSLLKFRTRRDLYEYFLIDVDMGGCFRTSRVVAALSSLQLYVHRCLLNLEQSASEEFSVLSFIDAADVSQEWEWRQNYRVWEANRKVFLYPENYLEPELRDNKTPLFQELEDDLLQRQITLDAAESAYRRYLSGFSKVAQLKTVGACYDADRECYWFVARSHSDPYEYYLRLYEVSSQRWHPWEKIELAIASPYASPIVHLGRVYLFWAEVSSMEKTNFVNGHSVFQGIEHRVTVHYSTREESGKWQSAQKNVLNQAFRDQHVQDVTPPFIDAITNWAFVTIDKPGTAGMAAYYRGSKTYAKVVPQTVPNAPEKLVIHYFRLFERSIVQVATTTTTMNADGGISSETTYDNVSQDEIDGMYVYEGEGELLIAEPNPAPAVQYLKLTLDLLSNSFSASSSASATNATPEDTFQSTSQGVRAIGIFEGMNGDVPYFALMLRDYARPDNPAATDAMLITPRQSGGVMVTNGVSAANTHDMLPVNDRQSDTVLQHWKHQHFIRRRSGGYVVVKPKRLAIRLNTTLDRYLSEVLFTTGLDGFLTLTTQTSVGEDGLLLSSDSSSEFGFVAEMYGEIPYRGSFGDYYRELFFHIPFLIANQLNARGRYRDAKFWYEKVFNPAAPAASSADSQARVWQFLEFRDVDVPKLKALLTNDAAIEQYQENPFNPHAIARLRLSAYQKAIVMKYVDNLIDWADDYFTQDTMESVNTAMMLYALAGDVLGPRPVSVGPCKTVNENALTYERLGPAIERGSEFLMYLENLHLQFEVEVAVKAAMPAMTTAAGAAPEQTSSQMLLTSNIRSGEIGPVRSHMVRTRVAASASRGRGRAGTPSTVGPMRRTRPKVQPRRPAPEIVRQYLPAFCVPPNDKLLSLWDRLDDRMFKIRNCMNILGERRTLALFQPPIDPMLLVRATALGLSIEEVITQESEALPAYRFTYLVEKARQYVGTVQSFGSALLGALDRKDGAELELLRASHENTVLGLTRSTKQQQVDVAAAELQASLAQQQSIERRVEYYERLLQTGLTPWEVTQQAFKHGATAIRLSEAGVHLQAGIAYLVPQVGSPFAMKYGGKELGDSFNEFAAWASALASISDTAANSAGLEAGFHRRAQEWEQQLAQAQLELKAQARRTLATEIRAQIAQRELEIYDKQIEQSREVIDFLRTKFTGTGLQSFLSTQLMRVYREAYQMALRVARQAERAYRFERDASDVFIQGDNWESERSGLLAGERLQLQLQRLERAYMDGNTREMEVTQSFSLRQIAPSALLDLQLTGGCSFAIDELFFDMQYPGQYRRLLKAVRLTIPSIVGPHVNVGAHLRLEGSQVRRVSQVDPALLVDVPLTMSRTIATSNAQYDGGLFNLDFRDDRYLPFEGAGAVSQWRLELPSTLRMFDYARIADVIVHCSYVAKYDALLAQAVDSAMLSSVQAYAQDKGLHRLISLRHDFPDAYHQLVNPAPGQSPQTSFTLDRTHFPMWLEGVPLQTQLVQVWPRPRAGQAIDAPALGLMVSGQSVGNWTAEGRGTVPVPGSPIATWPIQAQSLDKNVLDDLLLLVTYGPV